MAYEAEVDTSFDAQFYVLRSPFGEPWVRRRRYTHTLGLNVYEIHGETYSGGPALNFRSRMRLDADFGVEGPELDPRRLDIHVPGLKREPLDLMYAYFEGKGYLGGYFGFRVGRQYTSDVLGFWSFDGALLRLSTPVYFAVEAYGGFEQRGGLPLSTHRFAADGVYRGDRGDLELDEYPFFLEQSELAPAIGFAIESMGLDFLQTRLSYRRVVNRDTVLISPFPDVGNGYLTVGGDRVSTERVGYGLRVSADGVGSAGGSLVYDFYNQLISEYDASIDAYLHEAVTVGTSFEHYVPTFDGDSIFNWFSHEPTSTALARAVLRFSRRLDLAAAGGVKLFRTEGDPDTYAAQPERDVALLVDGLGELSSRYRWADGNLGLRASGESGARGRQVGADVTLRQDFDGGYYDTLMVLSLFDWSDALRPERDATGFSYVLGGGLHPAERARLGVEWEHAMNRLVGHRFRVLATLELTVFQ
jgi:hypothetical protein